MRWLRPAALLLSTVLLGRVAAEDPNIALQHAADAWDRGDYSAALTTYLRLLDSPAADRVLEPIALQTGEVFHTTELTADGGAPKFSPDGRIVLHEVGSGALRTTRALRLDAGGEIVSLATLHGYSASFTPDGSKLVYLKVPRATELADVQALVNTASGLERTRLATRLAELVGRRATIAVRDVASISGPDTEIDTAALRKSSPIAAADGQVLFVGWVADGASDQIYAAGIGAAPRALTSDEADKTVVAVNGTGTAALVVVRRRSDRADPSAFLLVSLPDGKVTTIDGSAPAFSGDGGTIAYVSTGRGEYRLNVASVGSPEAAAVVRRGPEQLDAPALAYDGRAVLFQMMAGLDWDVFVSNREGSEEARVTREIQHDVLPRFLGADWFFAAVGEARHRRSYVYEKSGMTRTRIFHNNTIRTIAPEYAWVPNPDGTKLLIVAERDGDTVSPQRGVYLIDLTRRVTHQELRARLITNLANEQALRATATRIFAPVADSVRRVVEQASTARVFEYEKALFHFGSKHITRPGNAAAARYLFDAYTSFGYEPEYQSFTPSNRSARETSNVLATLKGTTNPELVYIVSSHYDSVAEGPGADDNSSGTAALLEAARVLKDHPQPATIVFASFTGEEAGLLGSREYVRRARGDKLQILGALNNDMVGWANDHRLDATIRYSNAGIRDVQHAAAMQFSRLITYDARYYKNTDAAAFFEGYGDIVGGLGAYPILGNPRYHEPHDVLDTINHQLVAEVAKTTAASIMLLASSPSPLKGLKVEAIRDGAATVSWTPGPETGITTYVVAWGPAANPEAHQLRVTTPAATIRGVAPGTVVSVKAVNAKGLEGWDWARVTLK